MRIAIIDDEIVCINRFELLLSQVLNDTMISAECIDCFTSTEEFLNSWEQKTYDIVFLDIFLKDGNGINLAKLIRENDQKVILVFCSTSNEFASESYQVSASYYLTKPVSYKSMSTMMKKLFAELSISQPFIELEDGQKLFVQKMLYSEYHNHQITITMSDNSEIKTWLSQNSFFNLLKGYSFFIEINPGTIINMNEVIELNGGEFKMTNKNRFSISRSRKKSVEKEYQRFLFDKLRRF